MTIRTKLAGATGLLLAAVVFASGAIFYWAERRALAHKMHEAQTSLVESFAQSCHDALVMEDNLAAFNAARAVMQAPGVIEAYCAGPDGNIFAHPDQSRRGRPAPALAAGTPAHGSQKNSSAGGGRAFVLSKTVGRGTAVAAFSQETVDQGVARAMADALRRLALACAAALAAGLAGAFFLALHLTRPIHRIAAGMRALAEGKLDHRLAAARADELGQLARDFNAMAGRLGEVDEMKNTFVSNVTHELRSPLSAIESYANLVTDEWRAGRSEDLLDYVTIMRNNATRLGKLINDVLALARIDAEIRVTKKQRVDVAALLREIAELYFAKAKEKPLDLTVAPVPAGLRVPADDDKVRQILMNLVGNALKFTPAGGQIVLSAEGGLPGTAPGLDKSRAYVGLTVRDTGPGIAAGDQARIFSRFEQVAERRAQMKGEKGTGLGLAIAQGLAKAQGGLITVESRPGFGSAFTVYLPESA